MSKITVELLPGGHATYGRTVWVMHIANISAHARQSDCRGKRSEVDSPVVGTTVCIRTFRIRDHDRNGSMRLIEAARAEARNIDLTKIRSSRQHKSIKSRIDGEIRKN